jgi:hypothetical protein
LPVRRGWIRERRWFNVDVYARRGGSIHHSSGVLRAIACGLVASTVVAGAGQAEAAIPPTQLGWGETYSVMGALAELPAVAGYAHVGTADLSAFSESFGVVRPTGLDDPAMLEWVAELASGHDIPIPIPDLFNADGLATIGDWGPAMGWTGYVDAQSFVDLSAGGRASERSLMVISSDVDSAPFGAEVTPVSGGVYTFGVGQDGESNPANTRFDPSGRPVRMAAKDGRIAASFNMPPLVWWLEGPQPSLAEDATIAGIAAALDGHGVISAMIRRSSYVFDRYVPTADYAATPADIEAAKSRTTLTEEFSAVGVGWAPGAATTIVYAFADPSSASVAAGQLTSLYRDGQSYAGAPIADHVVLNGVVVADRFVVVTVTEASPWEVWVLFFTRDTPFTFLGPA